MTLSIEAVKLIGVTTAALAAAQSPTRSPVFLFEDHFEIEVYDPVSKRTFVEVRKYLAGTLIVRFPWSSSRRLRVRVHKRFSRNRRVFTVSYKPPFRRPSTSSVEIEGTAVASVLALRASKVRTPPHPTKVGRVVNYVSMPVGRPLRANPEDVTGYVPEYVWFGDGVFNLKPAAAVPIYHREWSGVRTPDFARKRALGKLPQNSHSVYILNRFDFGFTDERILNDSPDDSRYEFGSYWKHIGAVDFGPTLSPGHLTVQRNKAIERLRTAAVGETANLSETVATLNKTFDLIGGNARKIASAVSAIRKGNFKDAADALWQSSQPRFRKGGGPSRSYSLASNWLEYQYGWKPLLSDIHYAVTALGNLELQDKSVGSVRSSATQREVKGGDILSAHTPRFGVGKWSCETVTSTRFKMRFRVDNHFRAFLSQSGFTNPVSLAWELLPFSFVVDWFLPIGPYLESLDSWGGLVLLDGSETTFTRMKVVYQRYYTGPSYPGGEIAENVTLNMRGRMEEERVILSRQGLSSFPSLDAPSFKNPFTATHALNGLALLKSVFGR